MKNLTTEEQKRDKFEKIHGNVQPVQNLSLRSFPVCSDS